MSSLVKIFSEISLNFTRKIKKNIYICYICIMNCYVCSTYDVTILPVTIQGPVFRWRNDPLNLPQFLIFLEKTYRDRFAGTSSTANLSAVTIALDRGSVFAAVVMMLCCTCWYTIGALVTTLWTVLASEVAVSGTETTMLFDVVVGDWVTTVDDWDCVTVIITGVVVASVATGVLDDDWMGLSTFVCNSRSRWTALVGYTYVRL